MNKFIEEAPWNYHYTIYMPQYHNAHKMLKDKQFVEIIENKGIMFIKSLRFFPNDILLWDREKDNCYRINPAGIMVLRSLWNNVSKTNAYAKKIIKDQVKRSIVLRDCFLAGEMNKEDMAWFIAIWVGNEL